MPRRDVVFSPGGFYHIFNRGAHRMRIFYDAGDYLRLLKYIKKYAQRYQITIIAYCLLPNHYHFFNAYAQYFNFRREHTGSLFEGRFKHRVITDDSYLLNLIRYIHANPVLHGLIDDPGQWEYSNYLEWVDERKGALVDRAFINDHFDSPAAYRAFVLDYLRDRKLPQPLAEYLDSL